MPKIPAHVTFPLSVTSSLNVSIVIPFLFTSRIASAAPHMFIAPDGNMHAKIQAPLPSGCVMRTAMEGTMVRTYAKQPTMVAVIDLEKNVEIQKFQSVKDATQNV